jgi:tartrate dehydratase alpha subunit/fumarate hydratase class I-like protein
MSLEAYSKELGLNRIIQVEELIESHRSLVKELNQSSRKEFKENLHKAYQQAYQDGLSAKFIAIDKLLNMTIAELIKEFKE